MDAAINKANEKMAFLARDKETLRMYSLREMAQIDYNSGMKKAKAEGIAKGIAERNIEIARNLLKMNLPIEQVVTVTGLTSKEIKSLKI